MKKIYLLLSIFFVLVGLNVKAQSIEADGDILQIDTIIKTDTALKVPALYTKGIEWFATSYKNSKAVLQMQDKDAGIIVGKATLTGKIPSKGLMPESFIDIDYTIKLYFKDGKVRIIIADFIPKSPMGTIRTGKVIKWVTMAKNYSIRYYETVRSSCKTESEMLVLDLTNYYQNKSKSSKEW